MSEFERDKYVKVPSLVEYCRIFSTRRKESKLFINSHGLVSECLSLLETFPDRERELEG